MIDWITVALPLDWVKPVNDGKITGVDRYGAKKFEIDRRLSVTGAFEGTITIRTIARSEKKLLEISGNPIKFSQGHNLFGTNDLRQLVYKLAVYLCEKEKITPTEANLEDWRQGHWTISRIDIAEMLAFNSRAEVRAVLHFLKDTSIMQRRGLGHWNNGTLYFGKAAGGSRALPWMLKLYCKGDEMELNEIPSNADDYDNMRTPRVWGGTLHGYIPNRDNLCAFADNMLRIELTLRTKELQKIGLYGGEAWNKDFVSDIFRSYLSRMEISKAVCEAVEETQTLSIGLRRTLSEWKRGADIRQNMNRQMFSRHRKQIKEITGLDIATAPQGEPPTIPLRKMLIEDFRPVAAPEWSSRMLTALEIEE